MEEERMTRIVSNIARIERERCIQAVRDEPEYPDLPTGDERMEFLQSVQKLIEHDIALGSDHFFEALLRGAVRATKKGIEDRINNIPKEGAGDAATQA